jgi:hypothetical protein
MKETGTCFASGGSNSGSFLILQQQGTLSLECSSCTSNIAQQEIEFKT